MTLGETWYPTLYRGSVKDVLGPVGIGQEQALIFQYADSFSVFDWGRMPDALVNKGEALAIMGAHWFETLAKPDVWREFSKSTAALALRKANRFGAAFNEVGEQLQAQGLSSHYLGLVGAGGAKEPLTLEKLSSPVRRMAVKQVSVVRPTLTSVLGKNLPDYFPTRNAPLPRLVPLEVVFRFSCPSGSSLGSRVKRDPDYLASIGFPGFVYEEGKTWEFPIIELFTKLESADRPVLLPEALAISGLSATQLQSLMLRTVWVAAMLRWIFAGQGMELADGKLEWAIDASGNCFLVDSIGPDELRLLRGGVHLSKEFLRIFYGDTPW